MRRALTGMAAGLTALVGTIGIAACGGDDFVAQADEICSTYQERFGDSGNRGTTPEQIAAEMVFIREVSAERRQELSELEVPAEYVEPWDEFMAAGGRLLDLDSEVVEAAKSGDQAAINRKFAAFGAPTETRREAADEIGFDVCGQPTDPEVELTGSGPPDTESVPTPANSAEEAAESLVGLASESDCEGLAGLARSDLGLVGPAECTRLESAFGGAEVLGVEEYGPAAVAELDNPDVDFFTAYFVLGDGNEYRYVDYVTNDGRGLRPAPEGNDAVAAATDVVAALGQGREVPESLLAYPNEDVPVPVELEEELASGGAEEPVLLGINQALAFFLVEPGNRQFVIVLSHMPGGSGEYRLLDVHELQRA